VHNRPSPWVSDAGQDGSRREQETVSEHKHVEQAGEGVSDEEFAEQVADQTSSDRKHADIFERESDGATTDTEAAKASADELAGD
jgi:hypothetical protein